MLVLDATGACRPHRRQGWNVAGSRRHPAGADRPPLGVAEGDGRGLAAAGARLCPVAAQARAADSAAGHEQAKLPAGGVALHAAGSRHAGDPARVQLPQQPHDRQRARRRAGGERVRVLPQPLGELLAFPDTSSDPLGEDDHKPLVDLAEAEGGGDNLDDGLGRAGAPAGGAGPGGAGLAMGRAGQRLVVGGSWQRAQTIPAGLR